MRRLRNLWRFGSLTYPGSWQGAPVSWEYSFSVLSLSPDELNGKTWRGIVSREPWLQHLYVAEARWRLVKCLIAGALAGLWLALQ